jgi:probable HAF family extracellular repeat protein
MKRSLPYPPNSGLFRPARTLLTVLFSPMLALWAPVSAYAVPPWVGSDTPTYSLTDAGTLNGYFGSQGAAINDLGDVVGTDQGVTERAFLYKRGGKLIDLGAVLAPNGFSFATWINLEGQIVGTFSPSGNFILESMGYVYAGGQFQTLIGPNGEATTPNSINIFGQVVGGLFFPTTSGNGGTYHVFLRQPTGQITDLGTFGGTETPILSDPGLVVGAFGNAINDLSQIVGAFVASDGVYHSFLTQPGGAKSKDIGSLGGFAWATAVNDFAQVVGYSAISSATGFPPPPVHAFLYSGGKMRDLGTLPGGTSSSAFGINIFGQIVGGGDTGGFGFGHGFVYSNGQMHDLNNLLSPAGAKGWLVFNAEGINDRGQIIGDAVNALGEIHAVILTPVY